MGIEDKSPAAPSVTPTPATIRVAIIEDRREIRESLATLIRGTEGFTCTGSYRSMEEALAKIGSQLPDLALVDIGLPGMSGIEGIRILKEGTISRDAVAHADDLRRR